jgi:hypothetical protein
MKTLGRILLFLACNAVIVFVARFVGDMIVGAQAMRGVTDPTQAIAAAKAAERAFYYNNALYIYLGSLVASAIIVYRRAGAVVGVLIGAGIGFCIFHLSPLHNLSVPNTASSAVTPAPSTDSLVGRQMSLISPITIQVPYGAIQAPAGSPVRVLSQTGDSVLVSVVGGQTASVSSSNLR